jgi:hypothetical protein
VGEVGGGAAEEGGEEEQEAEFDEPGRWVAHVSSVGRGPAGRNGTWVLADEEELCVALACGSVGAADGVGGDCDHAEAGGVDELCAQCAALRPIDKTEIKRADPCSEPTNR